MNKTTWKLEIGFRGKRFYVFDDHWDLCIYEEQTAYSKRFCVLEMSKLTSRHEELEGEDGAKAAVLRRLIELTKEDNENAA